MGRKRKRKVNVVVNLLDSNRDIHLITDEALFEYVISKCDETIIPYAVLNDIGKKILLYIDAYGTEVAYATNDYKLVLDMISQSRNIYGTNKLF